MTAMRSMLLRLFVEPTANTWLQLFRYTFVGGFAFVVDFSGLVLLKEVCGLHYLLAASLAFVAGLLTNYLLSVVWVFDARTSKNRWMEFLVFALVGVVGLGLTNLFMWLLTDCLQLYYLFSKVVTTLVVYLWNFGGRKYLLFSKKPVTK